MPKSRTFSVDVWATRTGAASNSSSEGKVWVERSEAKQKLHRAWKADLGHQLEAIEKLRVMDVEEDVDEAVFGAGSAKDLFLARGRKQQISQLQKRYNECLGRFIQLEIELGMRQPKKNKGKAAPAPPKVLDTADIPITSIPGLVNISDEAEEILEEDGIKIGLECVDAAKAEEAADEPQAPLFEDVDDWEDLPDAKEQERDRLNDLNMDIAKLENQVAAAVDAGFGVLMQFHSGEFTSVNHALSVHAKVVGQYDAALDAYAKKHNTSPQHMVAYYRQVKFLNNAAFGQSSTIRGRAKAFDFEAFEALTSDESGSLTKMPTCDVQQKMLNGINMAFPFTETKPDFLHVPSHPQMNATRIVGSTMAYLNAAKRARALEAADHRMSHAVVDVGAGSFGAERLMMLKCDPRNAKLFLHAMIPDADGVDETRWQKNVRNESFMNWNCVPEKGRISLNRLNYCRHKAHECTCLARYGTVQAVAIHAAYHFEERDLRVLVEKCVQVEAVLHIPAVGRTIPTQEPEYEWVSGTQFGSLRQRLNAIASRAMTGVETVVLKPMRTCTTTYRIFDVGQMIKAGGMHSTAETARLESEVQTVTDIARKYGLHALSIGAVAVLGVATLPAPLIVKAACVVAAAATGTAAQMAVDSNKLKARFETEPPRGTEYTITAHLRGTYALAETKEDLVHNVVFKRQTPRDLVPEVVENFTVEADQLNRTTAMLLLAPECHKSRVQAVACLLRDNVPIKIAANTVAHSYRCAKNFLAPGALDPPPPPSLPSTILGSFSQLYALAWSQLIIWTLLVLSRPHWIISGVVARWIGKPTYATVLLNIVIVSLPLYLVTRWVRSWFESVVLAPLE